MTPTDDQEPLTGLARSIDSLFGDDESEDQPSTAAPEGAEAEEPLVSEGTDELPGTAAEERESARKTVESADPFMDMEVLPVEEGETTGPTENEAGEIRGPPAGVPVDESELDELISLDDGLDEDDDVSAIVQEVALEPGEAEVARDFSEEPEIVGGEPEPVVEEPERATEGPRRASDAAVGVDVWDEAPPEPPASPRTGDRPAGAGDDRREPGGDPVAEFRDTVERYLSGAPDEALARRIREMAAALRDRNEVEAVADAVERLVGATDEGDVQQAPVALAQLITTPVVAGRLAARLDAARHEERRRELVRVVSSLGHETAEALADALSETDNRAARRAFMEALVELGDAAREVVEEMVEDPRWFVVRNAVLILGQSGGEQAVQHLTSTLAHDDPRVRKETLLALAKIGGEDAGTLAQNKLADPDSDVRAAAAMACGELEVEKAQRDLLELLEEDDDTDVQVAALRALGQLGDPGAVQAIEKRAVGSFFSRPSTEIRIAAYRALAAIGTPHARSLLEDAADDRDPAVKSTVKDLLQD